MIHVWSPPSPNRLQRKHLMCWRSWATPASAEASSLSRGRASWGPSLFARTWASSRAWAWAEASLSHHWPWRLRLACCWGGERSTGHGAPHIGPPPFSRHRGFQKHGPGAFSFSRPSSVLQCRIWLKRGLDWEGKNSLSLLSLLRDENRLCSSTELDKSLSAPFCLRLVGFVFWWW